MYIVHINTTFRMVKVLFSFFHTKILTINIVYFGLVFKKNCAIKNIWDPITPVDVPDRNDSSFIELLIRKL